MIKYIFALTLLLSGSVCADQIQGHVIRVLDGDTLEILQPGIPSEFVLLILMRRKRNSLLDAGQ